MDQSIVLLTYKGKVLLMQKDYILATLDVNHWHFIGGVGTKNESPEETIQREVKKETSIQLGSLQFLESIVDKNVRKHFYHTHLTDDNVNHIVRRDGKILEFFSVKELDTLSLAVLTQLLLKKHKDLVEKTDQAAFRKNAVVHNG